MTEEAAWPPGSGEMARRIRGLDWAATPLGPIAGWPQSLRTAVDMILAMPGPANILWGPEQVQLYNDAYVAIAKDRHPAALGRPAAQNWPEAHAEILAPIMESAFAGRATRIADLSVQLEGPSGALEDRAFDTTWVPIRDEAGAVGGALETLVESTDRRRAQAGLRESEARHRLLVESLAQAVWETDPAGVVVSDSPSWRAYTGQSVDEWLGYGWLDAIHPDDRAYAERQWREAVAAQGFVDAEFRIRSADGGWRWTNVRAAPVRDDTGRIEKWAGMNIDIDARKRAEAALRESEARYRLLFDAVDDGFCTFEMIFDEAGAPVDFRYIEVNAGFEKQTGQRPRPGQTMREIFPQAEHMWLDLYAEVARTGEAKRFVDYVGGLDRWYDVYVFPLRLDESRVLGALFRDVTEPKRAEEALRESEARFRSLFETMGQGYSLNEVVRDAEGRAVDIRYIEHNPALERLTGVPASEAKGRLASDVFPGLDRFWVEIVDRVVTSGKTEQVEHELTPIGRWYQSTFYPVGRDRCVSLYDDITERKRAEAELREREERQAFLLRLSDALRAEPDADAVANRAIGMLLEQLRLDRCYITFYRPGDDEADFPYQVGNDSVPPLPATVRLSDFPDAYEQVLERTFVIEDDFERRGLSDAERSNSKALGMRAMVASTVRRGEKNPICSLAAVSSRPRRWTPGEIALVEEAAERTWAVMERARAEAALRESEGKFRTLFESMDEGYLLAEVIFDEADKAIDILFLDANPAAGRIAGRDFTGHRMRELDPNYEEFWYATYGRVALTGESVRAEHFAEPHGRWFDLHLSRVGPPASRRVASVFQDVTERKRAEAALRTSEERLRNVLEGMDEAFGLMDRDLRIITQNKAALAMDGRPLEELQGRKHSEVYPDAGPEVIALYERALAEGKPVSLEHRYRWEEGRASWLEMRAYPVPQGLAVFWRDITERKEAEAALRESEEKYRALFESMDEAYAVVEVLKDESGRWVDFRFLDANPAFIEHTSMPCPVGKTATELLGTPNPRWTELYGQALDTGEALRIEETEPTLGRTFDLNIFSLDRERNRVAVLFTNVTERKRAEIALRESGERAKLLLAELQHRVRNILAMIRSVARRTAETTETVEDYAQHLEARISAMARTQALLTRAAGAAVDLEGMVLDELEMQAAQPGQYAVTGPDVALPAKAAEVLGLALHELATNAVKYGALSGRGGRVDVRWALLDGERAEGGAPTRRLSLVWTEMGNRIDGAPVRTGFGTELITQRVPYELGGTGTMEFLPAGLVAAIEFPLAERPSILQTDEGPGGSAR